MTVQTNDYYLIGVVNLNYIDVYKLLVLYKKFCW